MSETSQQSSVNETSPTPTSSTIPAFSRDFFAEAPLLALLQVEGPTMDQMTDDQLEAAVEELRKRREARQIISKVKEPKATAAKRGEKAVDKALSDLGIDLS